MRTLIPVLAWLCASLLAQAAYAQTIAVSPPSPSHEASLPNAWVRMDLGGAAVVAPGSPTYVGYGIHIFGLRVEFRRFALLLVPRFANMTAPAEHGQSMLRLKASLGARYLFIPRRTSPFIGGGLTYGLTEIDDTPGILGEARGTGAGGYAEAGYEFFRGTWYQLSTGLRADTPFYRAHSEVHGAGTDVHRYHWVVPVSLDVTISFPWPTGIWIR
jgi:hypothetical protein